MGKPGKPVARARGGKGGRKPAEASAPIRGAQASEPSRFASGAEDIQPLGRVISSEITITYELPDGTEKTFTGPDAAAEAAAWLEEGSLGPPEEA